MPGATRRGPERRSPAISAAPALKRLGEQRARLGGEPAKVGVDLQADAARIGERAQPQMGDAAVRRCGDELIEQLAERLLEELSAAAQYAQVDEGTSSSGPAPRSGRREDRSWW